MKSIRKWFTSRASLIQRGNELELKVHELEAANAALAKRSFTLDSVVDTMNYMAGMSELECNVRMVLDSHGVDHKDTKGYGSPFTND
jgi:hypothetical protein